MRGGWSLILLPALVGSCNATAIGFGAVSISPIYGWEDGCNDVRIGGHGFDDGVKVTIGGAAMESPVLPTDALSIGFRIDGIVPGGTAGQQPVVVTNGDGATSEITDGYNFVACPTAFHPESVLPTTADGSVAAGTVIEVRGCNLTGATQVRVGATGTPVPLTPTCRGGIATFEAPAAPADPADNVAYFLDASGTLVYPQPCPADSDTSDTAVPACDEPYTVIYGGAQ